MISNPTPLAFEFFESLNLEDPDERHTRGRPGNANQREKGIRYAGPILLRESKVRIAQGFLRDSGIYARVV